MTRAFCAAALVCAAFANSAVAAPNTAYDFFPLEEGNTWVYATDNQGYLVDTEVAVISSSNEAYAGSNWYVNEVSGLFSDSWDIYDNTNRSQMWLYNNGWQHVFDFDAPVGASWTADAGACDTYDITVRQAGSSTTPAGVFTDLVDFGMNRVVDPTVRCATSGLSQVRFARGVGPVDFSAHGRKAHLMYARLDGAVVAAGPRDTRVLDGIETSMVLTADELTQPQGIYCITWPCPQPLAELGVAFVVTNASSSTQTLNFSSGQRFEIDLFDSNGFVTSWSDGRYFTQAAGSISLAPGESEVFYGKLPLGADGAQALGSLQVVGYLVAPNSGKLSVDIDVAAAQ